jgi:hypothetical protein
MIKILITNCNQRIHASWADYSSDYSPDYKMITILITNCNQRIHASGADYSSDYKMITILITMRNAPQYGS